MDDSTKEQIDSAVQVAMANPTNAGLLENLFKYIYQLGKLDALIASAKKP